MAINYIETAEGIDNILDDARDHLTEASDNLATYTDLHQEAKDATNAEDRESLREERDAARDAAAELVVQAVGNLRALLSDFEKLGADVPLD